MPKGLRAAHTLRVLEHVRAHPGRNQRSIARACRLTEGVTRKHLAVLLRVGRIVATPPASSPRYAASTGTPSGRNVIGPIARRAA